MCYAFREDCPIGETFPLSEKPPGVKGRSIEVEKQLSILHLEDNPDDCELMQLTLRREGIGCEVTRVERFEDFAGALERGGFDLIIGDFTLPSFDGLSALERARVKCPDAPLSFFQARSVKSGR
jgi:CheY-like chemotaxis protein